MTMDMNKIFLEIVTNFIKNNCREYDCGIFSTRNLFEDPLKTIFKDGELELSVCEEYRYIEVIGLDDKDFEEIADLYDKMLDIYEKKEDVTINSKIDIFYSLIMMYEDNYKALAYNIGPLFDEFFNDVMFNHFSEVKDLFRLDYCVCAMAKAKVKLGIFDKLPEEFCTGFEPINMEV